MSPRIRRATPTDRDPVVELLHTRMNARIPRERWRLLFDYPWRPVDAPDCGIVLEDAGEIVGFLGATYVDRRIDGDRHRVCNMSSWYLQKAYRGGGFGTRMARLLTEDSSLTYTDFTATPTVHALLTTKLGFAVLDATRVLFTRRSGAAAAQPHAQGAALVRLEDRDHEIRLHHAGPSIRHYRAAAVEFTVQIKRMGADVLHYHLLHASRFDAFQRHAQEIAETLLPEREPAVLAVDRRFIGRMPEGGREEPIPQPRLVKTERLEARQVDNLFNEVLLLDQKLP